jgi:type IV pilus assembly protein PilQ
MNARLCSLLVAGGVVLAGIQCGSLHGAVLDVDFSSPLSTLKGASFLPAPGEGDLLQLSIPGYQGFPRVQVLARPNRIVVDLPGVDRGAGLSKKVLKGLTSPQVIRWRVAQFSVQPDLTRVVLEVTPGTRAEVSSDADGVNIFLTPGKGAVQAQLSQIRPVPAAAERTPAPPMPDAAPAVAAMPAPVQAAAPAPIPVPALPQVPTVALLPSPAPLPQVAAVPAPVPAPVDQPVFAAVPAPIALPAVVAVPAPIALPAAVPVTVPAATLAAAKAVPPPLTPLPAINAPFQSLPSLAVNTLLPATPGVAQQDPMVPTPAPYPYHVESRKDERRGGRILGDVGGRYTGTRMTIDVVGTDLTSFLRIIADTAHLNLIVDSDVQGIYTFKFTDTPWDQVLDVILKHAGLGKEISNGIIRVAKVEKLQKEEEDRKRLDDAKALSGETQSITRPLSFAKAAEAKAILDKVLTKRGSLIIDERTNTLIITDLPRNLPLIDDLIAQLDVQIQQVQIEARVVEATKNWQQAFGVQWPTSNAGATTLTTNGTAAPWTSTNGPAWNSINNLQQPGQNGAMIGFSPGQVGVTDIQGPAGQFWLSFLSNRMSVNVILQALEAEGVVKIISSPKVVTQNNKKAKVLSGQKIPYPAQQAGTSSGAITVSFADANLSLEVTPQITNDGTILMDIHVEKSDANFAQQVAGTPTITQKLIETQVLVKDGGTAIMGGVYKNTNSTSTTGVPFLSKLPLIGFLFRNKNDQDQNDELLVFITPRILKN